jgi:hypothetical protein
MSSCSNVRGKAGLFSTARQAIWAIAIFVATGAAGTALAATITVHPEDTYGRIFVDIAGDITFADIKQFSDKIAPLSTEKVYVSLSSDGGSALAAEIGDLIRLSGMKTLVPENKKCASVWQLFGSGRATDTSKHQTQLSAFTAHTMRTPVSQVRPMF